MIRPSIKDVKDIISDVEEVSVVPLPFCKANHCWENVEKYVKMRGGKKVPGRIVWMEPKGRYVQLEAHCIWEMKNGNVTDPTPKTDGERSILFMREPLVYVDRLIPSLFIPLTRDNIVLEYIECLKVNEKEFTRFRAGVRFNASSNFMKNQIKMRDLDLYMQAGV